VGKIGRLFFSVSARDAGVDSLVLTAKQVRETG